MKALHPPTTQYNSADAVFESVPADQRPPQPKDNATDLQNDQVRQRVESANRWLVTVAMDQPITVSGQVKSVTNYDADIQVWLNNEKSKIGTVYCSFPKSAKDQLLALNVGDSVRISGKITKAAYQIDGSVSATISGFGLPTSRTTCLVMSNNLEVGDCKLLAK